MSDAVAVRTRFLECLHLSVTGTIPFRHWLLDHALPDDTAAAIAALPIPVPKIADTLGRRETNNSLRLFVNTDLQARDPHCAALAEAFQQHGTAAALSARCDVDLAGSYLRIEYCQDTDGFWLEPHTDIGAKLFTMLIYLSTQNGSASWGTDLLTADGTLVRSVPYRANCGLIFVPGADTWHGFHKRRIDGVRRSIIVNYVKPEWRSRHELAFPDRAVG